MSAGAYERERGRARAVARRAEARLPIAGAAAMPSGLQRRLAAARERIGAGERTRARQPIYALYLAVLLVLTVYQDFPLVNRIGEIGRTPIILLAPVFVFCELALLARHKRIADLTRLQRQLLGFLAYLAVISCLYVFGQFLQGTYAYGSENILVKAVKVGIYLVLILLYVRHVTLLLRRLTDPRWLFLSFFAVLSLLFAVMLVELASMPYALPGLHSGSGPYYRVRMLTSESSTTGSIVVVLGAIYLVLARRLAGQSARMFAYLYLGVFAAYYVLTTSSKGFLVIALATMLVTMLQFMNFKRKKNMLLLLVTLLGAGLFVFYFSGSVLSSFANDMENYTSSYTRLGTVLIALLTVLHHPLGVGTGAYLVYFEAYINQVIGLLSEFYYNVFGMSQINAGELLNYVSSDKNLGVKSGFFQWLMFGGIGTVVFFFVLIRGMLARARGSLVLYVGLVFTLLSLLYVTLEIKYEVWLLLAFLSVWGRGGAADDEADDRRGGEAGSPDAEGDNAASRLAGGTRRPREDKTTSRETEAKAE
ncbi:hypothetical protein IDH44_25695 [Paenibacillus sp. IB182496]|uniref:Uncharacterized protein n=1 Tax=Paenibacillus sabuli TaxID=2772509 RepID=A0A927BYA3_9BACL|nr:hypothetical protein [Paenibacillus sabuli]MBD2848587.1 hypothetical protein [Paenibacillus sabuli]